MRRRLLCWHDVENSVCFGLALERFPHRVDDLSGAILTRASFSRDVDNETGEIQSEKRENQ
jgi:hypothetical protein